MKTKPAVIRKLSAILATAIMLGPLMALAQPASVEKTADRPAPQRGAGFQDRIMASAQSGDLGVIRVLTEDQRISFREASDAQRDQTRAIEEKLRVARKAVVAAGLTEKFDEDAVRKKALEAGKLEAELAVLRAKALSKVKPPLSAQQIEQIKNPPAFKPGADRIRPVRRVDQPSAGPRDEHDLPPPAKAAP